MHTDYVTGLLRLVGVKVVHHNNITRPQGWGEAFFDIGIKHCTVDRTFKHKALRCPVKPD